MRPLLAIALGWFVTLILVTYLVMDGRKDAIERTNRSSAAFALLLEEHTASILQTLDVALGAVAAQYRLHPGIAENDPRFQETLSRLARELLYVRAVYVIRPDGHIAHDSQFPDTPHVSLADRDYFRHHQLDPDLERAVSAPVQSRSGQGWFLPVTQRIGDDHSFKGVVVAALLPTYFEALYRKMGLTQGDRISLFHTDGSVIAHYPTGPPRPADPAEHLELFEKRIAQSTRDTYRIRKGRETEDKVVSYAVLEGRPLLVRVESGADVFLGEWRRSAYSALITMSALTAALCYLLYDVARQRRRRELMRERRLQGEKLEAIGQLTGGIAHDFANMLGIVSMNLHLISLQSKNAPSVEEAVTVAQRALARGMELTSKLLGFAKQQPLEITAGDLSTLVESALPLLAQAAGTVVRLRTELGAGLPPCLMDETQLEVALVNLVINARDAMAGEGEIVLRTYQCSGAEIADLEHEHLSGAHVCLSLKDSGPGMSEAVHRRALEPFFTTKGQRGTGLGLSQVYGLMEQVKGGIHIDPGLGRGTTVYLFFRTAPPREAPGGT